MKNSNQILDESSVERILKQLVSLETLGNDTKREYNNLLLKGDPKDLQHQILLFSLARVCKYFDAYLVLAKSGYGEPSVNLLRSIFEASLWMRWILISKENAERYFNASKGESIRIAQVNIGRGLAKINKMLDPELIKKMLADEAKNNYLPDWKDLAKETGMGDLYALTYKFMSAMIHGTFLSLGERIIGQKISPDPDYLNIEPFIPLANNLLRDCILVTKKWIEEKKIRECPDIKALIAI